MKTSAAGRALIAQREGRRLSAYRDTRGIWTIGVGHTGRMSPPPVTAGMTITESECDAFLATDLAPVENIIHAAVQVPLSQNEFDALASLGFNIGAAGLRRSSVIRKLDVGDVSGAADAFLLWDHPSALAGRRAAERAQFLTAHIPDAATGSGSDAISAVRAQTLADRADATSRHARTTRAAGAATALGGAAAAAVASQTHHHAAALAVVAVVIAGGTIDGLVARWQHARAAALAANASKQAVAAAAAPRPSAPRPSIP